MSKSYNGKILRVNLSNMNIWTEYPDDLFYRKYMGGKGIALYYLLKLLKPGTDPLSPDNVLVFAASVLNGVPVPTLTRYTVAAKSPLTGAYGEAEAGGYWAPELKFAGFDAIVIEGKADHPVYLWIQDGKVEIRDARHLWGKQLGDVQEDIRKELGDKNIRVAGIGPAGENLVRFACVINELKHANGRTGMGAVMGCKNLKAIAVRGKSKVAVADEEKVREIAQWMRDNYRENPLTYSLNNLGTSGGMPSLNATGILPTHNFRKGEFPQVHQVDGTKMAETILVGRKGCYACSIRCKREVEVHGRVEVDSAYGGPEYETVCAFGPLLNIDDLEAIAKAHELCNKYTLDTISTGAVIAFAMECYENGILTKQDTGGLDLSFGNVDVMLKLIDMIAYREGIGDLLAEGVKRAAEKIGPGAKKYALHVKGQEPPMHDPRGKATIGISYAISPNGASHIVAAHDPLLENPESISFKSAAGLGLLEPQDSLDLGPRKVRQFMYLTFLWSLLDTLGVCIYGVLPRGLLPLPKFVDLVNAITGWETTLWELLKAGERTVAMARIFNYREGFTPEDDSLPERFFEPLENGRLQGHAVDRTKFREALDNFYKMMNWDLDTGAPSKIKLVELDIDWVLGA